LQSILQYLLSQNKNLIIENTHDSLSRTFMGIWIITSNCGRSIVFSLQVAEVSYS